MTAKLIAEEGVLQGQEFPLASEGVLVIGRDPDLAQIVIEDPSVSRQHLKCYKNHEGFKVENLSSTNPTQVNDADIGDDLYLSNGDSIKIGDQYFRFYSEDAEPVELPPEEEEETPEEPSNAPEKENTEEEVERDTLYEETQEEEDEGLLAEIDLDFSDDAPWLLKVVSGPNSGAQFSMHQGMSYILGTDPSNCDVVFHDASVSRQHAKLIIGNEQSLSIEDLGSCNGTVVEGEKIEERKSFTPNALISVGTTSFIVFDREGERKTIISPLLPSIVKTLTSQENKSSEKEENASETPEKEPIQAETSSKKPFAFILGGLTLFAILVALLFWPADIIPTKYDTSQILEEQIQSFPKVRQSFNPTTGRLLLVGHVLSGVDKDQLIYNLNTIPFVKSIENFIVVDEFIWHEQNQILAKNPAWKGVTVHSPTPGKFVISGYLQKRADADALRDYLGQNFPYLNLLEQKIIVEEDIQKRINVMLFDSGVRSVEVEVVSGEVVLTGNIPFGEKPVFDDLLSKFRKIPGVRMIKSYVSEVAAEANFVDLTNQYTITGSLKQPDGNISVVVNGRILTKGDILDNRRITSIDEDSIILQSKGIVYRIDYNQ